MQLTELEVEIAGIVDGVKTAPPRDLSLDTPNRPNWLHGLLTGKFFIGCQRHAAAKKNERNMYCMDCVDCICQHCLEDHASHKLLQIRRYVYHDVVRLQDITKLVDCSGVQTYIINSAKVVFLNQRPQPRPTKGSNACRTCDRSLQDEYRYCSLCCKVDSVSKDCDNFQQMLQKSSSFTSLDVRSSSPTSTLKPTLSEVEMLDIDVGMSFSGSDGDPGSTSSGSNGNEDTGVYYTDSTTFFAAPRRSRTSRVVYHPYCPSSPSKGDLSPRRRRKGNPQRAPAF